MREKIKEAVEKVLADFMKGGIFHYDIKEFLPGTDPSILRDKIIEAVVDSGIIQEELDNRIENEVKDVEEVESVAENLATTLTEIKDAAAEALRTYNEEDDE